MKGREGGCCIARYATGAHDNSKVDRIMLRFRPIAPKPVAGGKASDVSSSEIGGAFPICGGAKRKYAKDKKRCNQRIRRRKAIRASPEQKDPVPVVTLPLLPETPDPKDVKVSTAKNRNTPECLSLENRSQTVDPCWYSGAWDQAAVGLGGSVVTVECVTDTWEEGDVLLGSTDEERRVKLSKDTCPGFISDGYGRVTWTNKAYREMVGHEGGVWLATKMTVRGVGVAVPYPSFTCRVRVQYACGKEKDKEGERERERESSSLSLTVPCDVWRMDSGGFAWRLDVKAALSLSLGCSR